MKIQIQITELRSFWSYQVERLQRAKKFNWLPGMVPVAQELKAAAEQEMDRLGIHWNIKKKPDAEH